MNSTLGSVVPLAMFSIYEEHEERLFVVDPTYFQLIAVLSLTLYFSPWSESKNERSKIKVPNVASYRHGVHSNAKKLNRSHVPFGTVLITFVFVWIIEQEELYYKFGPYKTPPQYANTRGKLNLSGKSLVATVPKWVKDPWSGPQMAPLYTVPEQELKISKNMTTMETWTFYLRQLFLFAGLSYYFIAVLRLTKSSTLLSAPVLASTQQVALRELHSYSL